MGYRSAIRRTIKIGRGAKAIDLSTPSIIFDVIDGCKCSAAKKQIKLLDWDVFLALDFLRGPLFEPLHSVNLQFLTLKTVFLISLATARRVSEVHALSGLPKDIFKEQDGSFILQFIPEFRANKPT